jgi:LysR family hydrogen peroxide-inducible transcriptional activator
MNLRELEYLIELAKSRHFGKAAEACFVSQPTLSMQIKKLEEELGVVLFERNNKNVRLTATGEEIVKHAHIILQQCELIQNTALQAQNPMAGKFALGMIPTITPYLLPKVLSRLRKAFPMLECQITESVTKELLTLLQHGGLDAAVLALPVEEPWCESVALYYEPFLLASHKDHPLAAMQTLRQKDVKHQQILLLDEGHCLRDQALEICSYQSSGDKTNVRSTSIETLRQLVAANLGVTLIPELAVMKQQSSITYIRFQPPEPGRTVGLVWRNTYHRKRLIESVVKLITAMSKTWFEPR